jgi:hypothetical protein
MGLNKAILTLGELITTSYPAFVVGSCYQFESIPLANRTISAGWSIVMGIIKMTANKYLSRTTITIITIIINAI